MEQEAVIQAEEAKAICDLLKAKKAELDKDLFIRLGQKIRETTETIHLEEATGMEHIEHARKSLEQVLVSWISSEITKAQEILANLARQEGVQEITHGVFHTSGEEETPAKLIQAMLDTYEAEKRAHGTIQVHTEVRRKQEEEGNLNQVLTEERRAGVRLDSQIRKDVPPWELLVLSDYSTDFLDRDVEAMGVASVEYVEAIKKSARQSFRTLTEHVTGLGTVHVDGLDDKLIHEAILNGLEETEGEETKRRLDMKLMNIVVNMSNPFAESLEELSQRDKQILYIINKVVDFRDHPGE